SIRVIEFPENRRPAAARNAGIQAAQGRYIALLDADDVWMPKRLEVLVGFLEHDHTYSIATSDSYLLIDGVRTQRSWFGTTGTIFYADDQNVNIFRGNYLSNLLVYRKRIFDTYGLFDEGLWCEDWDRNIACLVGGERAAFIPEPLAYYRVTPGSLSKSHLLMSRDSKMILDRWLETGLDPAARRIARASRTRFEWDLVKAELLAGHRRSVLGRLLRLDLSAPGDVRIKALLWTFLPAALIGRIHMRRSRFLAENGGPWSLDEALKVIASGDDAGAVRYVTAVVLFGYPLTIRMLALSWLGLPPLRKFLLSKLLAESRARAGRQQPLVGHQSLGSEERKGID
ncbi:MAG TPA: glycosyltransferase family 2 protein, partial [Actinomycetota bacterium]|nr:glycosyltransferase family 2 protein [Actinomycetota bacterium]